MADNATPERAWVIEAKLQGDTREDVISLLSSLLIDLERGSVGPIISGGCSSGGVLTVRQNEGVTHDSYFQALEDAGLVPKRD